MNEKLPLPKAPKTPRRTSDWVLDSTDAVEAAAARTAATPSRVQDVPSEVLEAIDQLMGCDYRRQGTSIFEIVRFLRHLEELERFVPQSVEIPRRA